MCTVLPLNSDFLLEAPIMLSAFKSGLWGVRLAAAALRWEAAWCALTAVLPSFLCRPASSILINAAWLACSPFNMSNSLTDDLLHFSSLLFCLNLCSFVFFRTFQALSWFLFPPFLPSIGLISLLFLKFFPFLVLKLCTPLMFFSGYLHTQPGFKKSKVKKKRKKSQRLTRISIHSPTTRISGHFNSSPPQSSMLLLSGILILSCFKTQQKLFNF